MSGVTRNARPRQQPVGRKRCGVCSHPQLAAINLALGSGSQLKDLAEAYGLGRMTLGRHKETCLGAAIAVVAQKRTMQITAASILEDLTNLQKRTTELLDRAEASDDASIADISRVVRESRENLVTLGKLVGAFPKEPSVHVDVDNRTQTIVMPALQDMTVDELRALIRALPGGATTINAE